MRSSLPPPIVWILEALHFVRAEKEFLRALLRYRKIVRTQWFTHFARKNSAFIWKIYNRMLVSWRCAQGKPTSSTYWKFLVDFRSLIRPDGTYVQPLGPLSSRFPLDDTLQALFL